MRWRYVRLSLVITNDDTSVLDEKLERKARRNPGGLRLTEFLSLAGQAGFACRRGHHVCVHPQWPETVGLAEPHGGEAFVKPIDVRRLLRAIDVVRALGEEEPPSEEE